MRILFLSDNFPPETNAPASRLFEHAVIWAKAGHDVTVITGAPNFPEGKVFPGYANKWHTREDVSGINVLRVKTYITANDGFVKRTLDYLSFAGSAFIFGLFQPRPDVLIATSPQFFCALGGWALAKVRRLPFVFELRDLWPATIKAVGAIEDGFILRALERLELFLYRQSSAVIAVTDAFREELTRRGIDRGKIAVVVNGVDLTFYVPRPRDEQLSREYDLGGKFVVGYLGTHGMCHGLSTIVDAAERLQEDDRIVFLFVGSGAQRKPLEEAVAEKGLKNVRLIGPQPKHMMPRLWSLCDLSLVPLRDDPVFETVIPSKIFECMGMGIPMLMSIPEGAATSILRRTGAGVTVRPEDPEAIAAAARDLAGDSDRMAELRQCSLRAAQMYSRERQAKRMLQAVEAAVAGRPVADSEEMIPTAAALETKPLKQGGTTLQAPFS